MPVYPSAYDSLPAPDDGVSEVVAADITGLAYPIAHTQQAVGLHSDPASSSGSIYARIKNLEAAAGGIFKQATAPSSPATDDLWLDTDDTGRPLYDFRSTAWALIGANALQLQGIDVDATAPTDTYVLTYDAATTKWKAAAQAGGMANPLTETGSLLIGGAVSGGVAAPDELPIGTTVGQYLSVTSATTLGWVTPPFVNAPSGPQQGDVLYYNGTTWTRLGPGTTGQFLKTFGASSNPAWANLPSSPPGSAIAAPVGSAEGDLLVFDGTDWVLLTPGTSGLFLKSNGTGALPTWAAPASGGASFPFTSTGDTVYSSDMSGTPARLAISGTNAANKFLGIAAGIPAWKALGGIQVDTYLEYAYQASAPGTPTSAGRLYALASDGHLRWKAASGTVFDLCSGGGGGSGYATVQDTSGTPLAAESILFFTGTAVASTVDDPSNGRTIVTINATTIPTDYVTAMFYA